MAEDNSSSSSSMERFPEIKSELEKPVVDIKKIIENSKIEKKIK